MLLFSFIIIATSLEYPGSPISIKFTYQDTSLYFETVPLTLAEEYYHRKLLSPEDTSISSEIQHEEEIAKPSARSGIQLKGTKAFGISFGSRYALSFDQSMQIRMGGNISKDIQIEGVLSDDGVPIQPEGTTQELKDIDEMHLNVRRGDSEIKFGDFNLCLSESKFGVLERKLEGIVGNIHNRLMLGGAFLKGKWLRRSFVGVTGKQGPYELSLQGIVVPGSDKVRLNNKLVQRGKDYIIDYSAAHIIFTPQKAIEDGDNIVVEFQQKDENYKRNLLVGEGNFKDFRVLFFKEEDMKNSSFSDKLSPEKIKTLEEANGDSSAVWISGATLVGTKQGSYIKKDSIYEYVGYNNGNYEVSFTNVGESKGDYEFDPSLGGYSYMGKNNGSYESKIRVALPQSRAFFDIGYEKEVHGAKVSLEGAFSRLNPNSFGSQELLGKAFLGNFTTKKEKWSIGGDFRYLEDDFCFPGTPDTVNLPGKRSEMWVTLHPATFLNSTARFVRTQEIFEKAVGIQLSPQRFPTLSYNYSASEIKKRNEIICSYRVASFVPFVRYNITEEPQKQSDLREIGVRGNCFELTLNEKKEPETRIRTSHIALSKKFLNLSYTCKETFSKTSKFTTDLGNLKFSFKGFNLAYELTSLEHDLYREEYYKVNSGKGSFSRDSTTGMYYPDTHGDYEKRLIPCNNPSIYKNFSFAHSLILHPTPYLSIRLGSLKKGEGTSLLFWGRSENASYDRNQVNFGFEIYDLFANYTKEDYRENRISNYPCSGGYEVIEVGLYQDPLYFEYNQRRVKREAQNRVAWDEKSNVGKIKAGFRINAFTSLDICLQGEEKAIKDFLFAPENPDYKFYGCSGEPILTSRFNSNRLEGRFRITKWWSDINSPTDVKAIYPPGVSTEWEINFSFLPTSRTEYILSYQGSKSPDYPADHMLNAEARIHF